MIDPKNRRRASAMLRVDVELERQRNEEQRKDERAGEIDRAGHADERGREAERQQRQRVDDGLTPRAAAVGLEHRQHREPRPRVILAIDPCDRQKVRQLPQENDAEEDPRALRQLVERRCPADDRRQRPGDRANHRRKRRMPLQRRVDDGIGGHRQERHHRAAGGWRRAPGCPTRRLSGPARIATRRACSDVHRASAAGACAASARRTRARESG